MKKLLCLIGLLILPRPAAAPPAVRLVLSNNPCTVMPCPPISPPPSTTVASGTPFDIFVAALDGANARDPGYTGTVNFTSTDPLTTLPPSYTFVPADEGGKGFTAILRTPGSQTITVRDPVNNLIPGTLTMTVTGQQVAPSVPTLSGWMKILLALALAVSAIWLLRLRA